MNWKVIILAIIVIDLTAISGYALHQVGYIGIWQAGLESWGAGLMLAELAVFGLLSMLWMVQDARGRALNPWPFVLITLAAGAFGPLLYLVRRELVAATSVAARA